MNRVTFGLILALLGALPAFAHRLTIDWEVRGDSLRVTGKCDDTPAVGADVELRSVSGTTLASGLLDETGSYRWRVSATGDVTVVINAGLGHRRTLILTEAQLRLVPPASSATAGPTPTAPGFGEPASRGESDGTFGLGLRVLLGVTFLLAAAAAWMSHCNGRRLTELEGRGARHESRS
ncbi:MAG: hypothetical protein ACYDC1_19185 [Limisphaerales bacterium]